MKILEVIDNTYGTDSILQNTDWTKTWLDWVNIVPLLQAQLPPDRISKEQPTVEQVKAKIDAWRRANPNKFPEDAWKELGGKGPAPTPNEKMKGRDLRTNPPDDSGTWVDSGSYWTHTIPPFIHAIKPDPTNKHTWGPKGGDKSYIPIADQISSFRPDIATAIKNDTAFQANLEAEIKKMPNKTAQDQMEIKHYRQEMIDQETNRQIEARLRAIPGNGPGNKMYSDREINDGMRDELSAFNLNRALHLKNKSEEDKAEKEAKKAAQKYYNKNKKCPEGWIRDAANKACVRDPNYVPVPEPEENQDGDMTCPEGWKYDEENEVCVKDGTTPVTVDPTIPVNGACGAGYKLDASGTKCEKISTTPPANDPTIPVNGACGPGYTLSTDKKTCVPAGTVPPVNEKINMIFPVGNINTPRSTEYSDGHKALDIADQQQTIKYGTDIVAPEDGTVFFLGTEEGAPGKNGYGLHVKLRSKDGRRVHEFGHLSRAFPADRTYKQGDKIAEVGGIGKSYTVVRDGKDVIVPANQDPRPGKSSGIHLHWGIQEEGNWVDPLKYFK